MAAGGVPLLIGTTGAGLTAAAGTTTGTVVGTVTA